ncbi:MAG: DUF885 domain-containing protein [Sphingobium sp.]|nr:DUF885 domain-containing protein [Sphingobium sp.]
MTKSRPFGRLALASATLALLAGCSPKYDSSEGPRTASAAPAPSAGQNWTSFRDAFLEGYFRHDPTFAVYQGRHDFDGQLPDLSEAGLKAFADFLRSEMARAQAFDPSQLSKQDAFERAYLISVAKGQLFWLTDADQPHRNPAFYMDVLDPNTYVARNYADAPTRMKALIAFFKQVPRAGASVRANLRTPLPLSFINHGVAGFRGFADYYTGDAKAAFASVKDAKLQAEFDVAAKAAAKAMTETADWLESHRATATQGFALGADKFARMLEATEMVTTPLDRLEALGEADLKRNQDALKAACADYAPGQSIQGCMEKLNADKSADGPVAEARRQIPVLRDFVLAKDLVSIPGTEQALVEESPPYNRQNSAYIDPPGPYEKGIPSIYYISPPDPAWTKEVQDAFVPGKKDLLFTTVHEVMPGHFLQFLHANRSPSIFGRVFVGYAFAEGWAHYTEELMWEAGYGDGDPGTHVGQLSNALLRDCRFLSAIRLHTGRMTQAQSEQMFKEQCFQDEGNSRQQAARGTYDPAYLNYTLGKLMIRKLREDWTASRGGRAAWKPFHDQFLSYGGPPIPLVRQQMMGGEADAAF